MWNKPAQRLFFKANSLLHFRLLLPWDSVCHLSGPQVSRPLPGPPTPPNPVSPTFVPAQPSLGRLAFHAVPSSLEASIWRRALSEPGRGQNSVPVMLRGARPCIYLKTHVQRKTVAEAGGFASSGGRQNPLPCSVTSCAWPAAAQLPAPHEQSHPRRLGTCCPRGDARSAPSALGRCPALRIPGTGHPAHQTLPLLAVWK